MNSDLLLALGLALVLGVVVAAVLLLRARGRPAPARMAPPAAAAPPAPRPPPDAGPDTAAQIDAQRHAATEALRQARQRKADEAARLQAERDRQARAEAEAQADAPARLLQRPQAPPARPLPPAQPLPPVPPVHHAAVQRAAPTPPAQPPQHGAALERPLLGPLAIGAAGTPAGAASPGLAPLRRAQPPRPPLVLLADDSKVVRVKTGRLLEKQGWQVLLAEDGQAALQAMETQAPDLLITDVEMPGLDGFELTRRLRAHPRFGRLPVIMITSSDTRHRAEANAAGVNLLLGKPYAEETLLAQVKAMLEAAAQRSGTPLALH